MFRSSSEVMASLVGAHFSLSPLAGRGLGWGDSRQTRTRGESPSPGLHCMQSDLSPQAGRGEESQLICPSGKISGLANFLSSPSDKNILIFRRRKSVYIPCRPAPQRGGSRSSRNAGRDAMDAGSAQDGRAGADGEVVWSWTPSAGVDGGYQAWYAGESTKEAVKPLCGECRVKPV
jgi:hypothetical protein